MTPSEIRLELIRQHEEIRSAISETRSAATRSPDAGDVRARALRLAERLRRHNLDEEHMLQDLLRTVDAWGPMRVDIMNEQHVAEHEQLWSALSEASGAPDASALCDAVLAAIDRVLFHIAREEAVYLSEDVLRDDAVVIDQCSG
jgi:hypothetical protein